MSETLQELDEAKADIHFRLLEHQIEKILTRVDRLEKALDCLAGSGDGGIYIHFDNPSHRRSRYSSGARTHLGGDV